MKHITPFIIFGLLWCLPGAVHAQEVPFPGMSPQGYYASVAHFLRNPMVKDGVIIGENFERRDKSLFSDSFYADVVLYGKGPGGALSGGTVGATWQFPAATSTGWSRASVTTSRTPPGAPRAESSALLPLILSTSVGCEMVYPRRSGGGSPRKTRWN
ncbi:hypothetical protein KJ865_03285 [Myxococcota bacterium]|nr:hypothetical protein [Myxococcota bacterium]